jgi:predicted nucleic acid-binding protein
MTILDTNVLSALMRDVPDKKVEEWLDRQPETSIWTTSVTVFEVQVGLLVMPAGRKKSALSEAFELILDEFDHRIAVFDEIAGREAANLTAARQKDGRVGELRDTMIAGIVLARHATLATRNVAHFNDIPATVINPWTA